MRFSFLEVSPRHVLTCPRLRRSGKIKRVHATNSRQRHALRAAGGRAAEGVGSTAAGNPGGPARSAMMPLVRILVSTCSVSVLWHGAGRIKDSSYVEGGQGLVPRDDGMESQQRRSQARP